MNFTIFVYLLILVTNICYGQTNSTDTSTTSTQLSSTVSQAATVNSTTTSDATSTSGATPTPNGDIDTVSPITQTFITTTTKPMICGFDVGSFIGGIALCAVLLALVYGACTIYKSRKSNYNTL